MPEARQGSSATDPAQLGNYYEAEVPDTLDLADHAGYGINHFTMSISEENDYEMYWGVQAMHYKPDLLALVGHEGKKKFGGAFGDYNPPIMDLQFSPLFACQAKCIEAMAMERLMSGSRQLLEREARMMDVFTSYLGDEGLHWVPADPNKPWLGPAEILPIAHTHGQGRMLRAMIIWYQYTGDPVWKERVDRMVNAFDTLFVVHRDDYAYVPIHGWRPEEYFRSCYTKRGWRDTAEPTDEKSGEEGSLFCHQGHLPGALANWHLLTGNEQALRLSGELSRFYTKPQFWSDWEGGEYPLVNGAEHAHWTGHYHGYINVLRAVLEYAIAANDARLKAFVRDGYEWSRHGELATIGLVGDGQGCGCGRIIGLAVKLSDAGIGDYWEDVDRYIRNHGVEMQFTPEDVPFLEALGEGKPPPPQYPGMTTENVIETTVGAYSNHVAPYKTSTSLCCSPHGNMGLFYAWDGALRHEDGVARVNLLLNRASPWMDVDSSLPYEGKVVLRNKSAREAFVRIPLWVDKHEVRASVSGGERPNRWHCRYLHFEDLTPNDTATINFPVVETTQHWTIPSLNWPGPKEQEHACRFRGNTLVELSPELMEGSPLYRSRSTRFAGNTTPIKKTTRYATDKVLRW